MQRWIEDVLERIGYGGVVALMLLENVFPPIPSEVVMPCSGFAAARGELTLGGVILAGGAGSVLGALVLYSLGAWLGAERLEGFAARHGRWLTLTPRDLRRAGRWFERRGFLAVLVCRFVPGVRSVISIPAGVFRMRLVPFLVATAVGTTIWAGALAAVGWALGERYDLVERWLGPVAWVVVGALAAIYLWRVVRWDPADRSAPERV